MLAMHFLLALFALFNAPAHPPGHDAPAPVPSTPPIVFEATSIDLGPVPDTAVITRAFRFTNTSGRAIRLGIGGCNHCGIPVADKPLYQAAETGVVIVELNPIGRQGPMRAGGVVRVSDAPGFSVQIDLIAEVRPRVWFEPVPGSIALAVRGTGSRTTWLVNGRAKGFRVERAVVKGEHLSVTVADPAVAGTPDDPWTSQAVTLTVDPRAPSGTLAGELTLDMADKDVPQRVFALSGDVVGDVLAEPDPIMLGDLPPESPFVAQFLIRSRRGQPVQVLDIEVADPGKCSEVVTDLVPAPDLHGWVVRVSGRAPSVRVMYTDVIVALRSVGADGAPERVQFNTRLTVRKSAPAPNP